MQKNRDAVSLTELRGWTVLASVMLIVAGVAGAGTALADDPAPEACELFGTRVAGTDADVGVPLTSMFRELAFYDADGDGELTAGETVYLAKDAFGTVQANDLRLTGPAGTLVAAEDEDFGRDLEEFHGEPAFADADGDHERDPSEPLFLDQGDVGQVDTGDVRLTPADGQPAGELVEDGDPLVGEQLEDLHGQLAFFDADGDGRLSPGDVPYLDADDSFSANPGDVRLGGRALEVNASGVFADPTQPAREQAGLTAQVNDAGGQPVSGLTVFFYVEGELACSATTNETGHARCGSLLDTIRSEALGYTAEVEPAFPYCGGSDRTGTLGS